MTKSLIMWLSVTWQAHKNNIGLTGFSNAATGD